MIDPQPQSRTCREESKAPTIQSRINTVILSKEEREANLLNKFKSAITKSLENLNIKTMLDIRIEEKESVIDEDNVSVTSSRYFANHMNKGYKNMKLPFIIGTGEFFRHEYLGVYQGDSLVNDNNGNHLNYDRRPTTMEINVEEMEMNHPLIRGNISDGIYINSGNIPTIPGIPSVPIVSSVPQANSIPNVPKGKVPVPPALNLESHNNNVKTVYNTTGDSKQNMLERDLGNVYAYSVKENEAIPNTNVGLAMPNNSENENKETTEVSFKDSLNKMFPNTNQNTGAYPTTKSDFEKNTNIPLTNPIDTQYNPSSNNHNQRSDLKNLPQNKLDHMIRRPTIFDNIHDDDDDDEDNSGLFKKNTDKKHLAKSSLFDSVVPQNNLLDNRTERVEDTSKAEVIKTKEKDTLQTMFRESNQTNYTEQNNTFNTKNKNTSEASTNMLIETKNKNLESKI